MRSNKWPQTLAQSCVLRGAHVVALNGGLGNQLFQYAFGEWLRFNSGLEVRYDLSAFRSNGRRQALSELGINIESSSISVCRYLPYPNGRLPKLASVSRKVIGPKPLVYDQGQLVTPEQIHTPSWWYGYWQRREFTIPAIQILRPLIQNRLIPQKRIGIHIRRGDFLGTGSELPLSDHQGLLSKAMDHHPEVHVVVFSDDPEWCRQNLALDDRISVHDSHSDIDDFFALASSEILVLSRSTFSWWAAEIASRKAGSVFAPAPFKLDRIHGQEVLLNPLWRTSEMGAS